MVSSDADVAPPANRWDLTRTGMYTERGKPDVIPLGRGHRKMSSMRQRVKERGKRKCLPVMGWIGVESQQDDIIPRESEQTSPWSHITRELEKPTQEAKQMTEAKATGAVSREPEGWYDIDFKRAYRNVRRLQARIVKATQDLYVEKPRPAKGVSEA